MARFTIYSYDSSTGEYAARYVGTPVYHGTHLKVAYLEFKEIASPTPIPWATGEHPDYVDYSLRDDNQNQLRTGFRYKLYTIPQPTKQAVSGRSGESFVYKDVQFHCATKDLEICPFRDLVISDNTVHFTTLPEVATYEDVAGIARRIQENLDAFYGTGVWSINVFTTTDPDLRALLTTVKEFSLSGGTCLDALDLIYSQWRGIGWVYSVNPSTGVNTITIGRPNIQDSGNTTSAFSFGLGNGITVLRKEQSDKNEFATRIYAYGSTRNLVARYYNNLTPAIKDAQSVYIPNLMIPPTSWGMTDGKRDARKAYLQAPAAKVSKYGLRPKTIYFDGTGDYEEIYPSIEGVTTGDIRTAMGSSSTQYYPSTTAYPLGTERVDEVLDKVNPTDNGVVGTSTGGKYTETVTLTGKGSIYKSVRILKTELEVGVDLGALTNSAVVSNGGTVKFTPAVNGVIGFANGDLGGLVLMVYLTVDGETYRSFSVPLNKTAHSASIAPEEISCTIETGGEVTMYGYVEARTLNPSADFDVIVSATAGNTTLNIEAVLSETFTVYARQFGFDIAKQQSSVSGGLCTIAFKSGWCAGREFTVKKSEYDSANDRWALTVARQSDDSIGQYFPNNIYRIENGDRFVLLDLTMPEIYITSAQVRLYNRALEVLDNLSTPKMVYEPEIDAKVLAASPEVITEGMYMPIVDADVVDGGTDWVLIDSIEIDEGAAEIPTYKVTLQDEKRDGFFSRITRATGRNTRSIREMNADGDRKTVETTEPDYEVATKASGVGSQFFVAVRDEETSAIVAAKALYNLHIIQTPADEEEDPPVEEVTKDITEILRHLTLRTVTPEEGDPYKVLVSDITIASLKNLVAGGFEDGGDESGDVRQLDDLVDVELGTRHGGDVLFYDGSTNHWINSPLVLDLLGDVSVTGGNAPTDGQVLTYNAGIWTPKTVQGGGGGSVDINVPGTTPTIGTSDTTLVTINSVVVKAKIGVYVPATVSNNVYTITNSLVVGTDASGGERSVTVKGGLAARFVDPQRSNQGHLGSSDNKWATIYGTSIYGTTLYENGTALSSKYQAKLPNGSADGQVLTWKVVQGVGSWGVGSAGTGGDVNVIESISVNGTAQAVDANKNVNISCITSVALAGGTNNGTLKLTVNGTDTDNIAVKGLKALAFKASIAFSDLSSHPSSISGYGINDAKIENGVITLGEQTITPLTASDLDDYVTATDLTTALDDYPTTSTLDTLLAGKQDVISDLSTIRSGASAGATAYQKPANGIPASDLATGVIPTVNNATLALTLNGTPIGTFTANASANKNIDISALTAHQSLGIYAGATGDSANSATSNPYILLCGGGDFKSQIRLMASGSITVESDRDGNITIGGGGGGGPLSPATETTLGGIKIGHITEPGTRDFGVALDADNKAYVSVPNYTPPNDGANVTISAGNGKVLSAITVQSDGRVTSVSSKTLTSDDIPDLSNVYLPLTANKTLTGDLTIGANTNNRTLTIWGGTSDGQPALILYGGTSSSNVTKIYRDSAALQIKSATKIGGTLETTGNATINGTLDVTSNAAIGGTLAVTGASTFSDNVTIGASASGKQKSLTIWGPSSSAAIKIYGGTSSQNVVDIYYGSSALQISKAIKVTGNINATGNITATGNVIAGATSDRRLKKDIRSITLSEAADVLSVLNPVTYRWNEKAAELGDLRGVGRGFLADEYLDILPNAGRKIWGEYDAIDYNQVIPYLVAGWQQTNLRIRILEGEIATLREENQRLKGGLRDVL